MKKYDSKQVVRLIKKALKDSRTQYSFMDIHGEKKWIKKYVKS